MTKVLQQSDGLLSFDILINGSKIKDSIEVQEISIEMEVNRITSATFVVHDGGAIGAVNEPFVNSEGDNFIPGNEIEISLGYDNKRDKVFKGIVVFQQLKVKARQSQLMVVCKDKAFHMTKGRHNSIFQNKTDADAIKNIVAKYGLELEIGTMPFIHPVLMQYDCSDWDYLVIRAEANNMTVHSNQNKLGIKQTDYSGEPQYEINAAQYIIDIDLSLGSANLADMYTMSSWDSDTQEVVSSSLKIKDPLGQGNLSAAKLSQTFSNSTKGYTSTSIDEAEMKTWLESQLNMAILEKIQGKITVPGNANIVAGDIITLSGFSKRFNGKAYISKVTHVLEDGDWITELVVGKEAKPHASLPDIRAIEASGLLPGVNGTQIATVKKIVEDPDNNYRVLVILPAFTGTGQDDGIWARIASPYASDGAGFYFFPEIGDEVLLNFINNDPRFPVITGSLYSKKNKPKEIPDEENQFKSIYSKSGINIRLDDKDKILVIETPDGNSFTLNDMEKSITLKDIAGSSLVMDDSGVRIDSSKNIKLSAKGDVEISAIGSLRFKANSDVKVDGTNIQLSAKTGLTAKGNASAEISASGQTTVKGAMVMIN